MLFAATSFGHVANLLFQRLMAQMFGHDQFDEYGVMNTMLSLFGLFALPMSALQLAIARQTAILDSRGDSDGIAALLQRAMRRLAMVAMIIAMLLLALSPWLKSYLKLARYEPIFVTVGLIVVGLVTPVFGGALQGLKRFGWLSVSGILSPLFRIGAGVWLVWADWKASGALFGTLAGSLIMLIVCGVVLGGYLGRQVSRDVDTSVVYRYLGPTLISLICYAGLVNLDLMIVKHYFSPEEAAQYSAASLFGRAIGWLIAPLATVLFPHVWDETNHHANRALLLKFILVALGLGMAAACVCTVGKEMLASLLLGRSDPAVSWLIPRCVWAMLPIGVANIFLNFVMARGRYGFLAVFVALTLLCLVGFALWHDTLRQILAVVALFGVATLALFVAITFGRRSK